MTGIQKPRDVHLIAGCTGAGKSTYAFRLAKDIGGVRFAIDEWMERLHNQDKPDELRFEWFYERVQRNCHQMRCMAEQLVPLSVPVIFDCGLTNRHERGIFVNWAEEHGFSTQLHYVDVPTEIRWQRVLKRNAEQAETFQFEVTREMFDGINAMWEAPSEKEMHRLHGVRITD
ncbi:AAA family ATPase [Neptunicoccus sediminis]|uniref:AAA family ATPase n=1 Tax=Neptunicoccus sediminis TaxID=1892596 RepID=UPI0012FF8F41|nr:ATP-binding protein [Neptunicoccus sediminis]